jgi:exosortase
VNIAPAEPERAEPQASLRSSPHTAARKRIVYLQGIVLFVLVVLLYSQSVRGLIHQWFEDPNYSHGLFVPFFSALLLWKRRNVWTEISLRPALSGLVLIICAMGLLVVGTLGAELFLPRASLVVLLGGLLVYFAGWPILQALWAPWLSLFLMIPWPVIVFNEFAFPLQLLASRLACSLLDLLQVPVLREGNVIMLPSMSLDVVEACSGLRSLMSLITIAIFYSVLTESRIWMRYLLIALAIPLAVGMNALRIVVSALLAQYVDPQLAEGFFHAFSGIVLFLLSLGILTGFHALGIRLSRKRLAR